MSIYQPKGSPFWWYDFQLKGERYTRSTEVAVDQPGQTRAATEKRAKQVEDEVKAKLRLEHRALLPGEAPARLKNIPTLDVAAKERWEFTGGMDKPAANARLGKLQRAVLLVGPQLLVTQITGEDIARAMTERRKVLVNGKGPSNRTINLQLVDVIRSVINHACDVRQVPRPAIKWSKLLLPVPAPNPRRLAQGTLDKIASTPLSHWRDLIEFQGATGLRLSQLFFRPCDIDLEQDVIHIDAVKGSNSYEMPILPRFRGMLGARKGRAEAAGLDTIWFRELKSGRLRGLRYNGALSMYKNTMTKAGVRAHGVKGSHDLRRHAASEMYAEIGDLGVVQLLLGHKSIKSTQVYAKARTTDLRKAMDAVQEAKSRKTPEVQSGNVKKLKKASGL